ncbi:hypothetical protein ACJMK2_016547 [Sinanodonta woodiana]|uniref:Uncharacterized protein n=1 Tax=Sinanodonta woodiana TaxID=1069815 RepID=A0ABD3UUT1_SINWO
MAVKYLLALTLLASTIELALADSQCNYSDGKVLFCDSCCEYDCCNDGINAVIIGGSVGGAFVLTLIITLCSVCVRRRRIVSRAQIRVHRTPTIYVVTRSVQTAGVNPDIPVTGATGRPVYNLNVPQTGPYSYEQPITFARVLSGFTPRTEILAAEPPPPYSSQKSIDNPLYSIIF